jgi:hypothetical protein
MIEGILAVEFAIAFAVGVSAKRALWRFLVWLVFPPIVAIVVAAAALGQSGEAGGWALLGFVALVGGGFVVAGLGSLFGYLVARMPRPK